MQLFWRDDSAHPVGMLYQRAGWRALEPGPTWKNDANGHLREVLSDRSQCGSHVGISGHQNELLYALSDVNVRLSGCGAIHAYCDMDVGFFFFEFPYRDFILAAFCSLKKFFSGQESVARGFIPVRLRSSRP